MADDRLDPEIRAFVETVKADWARHPPLTDVSIAAARAIAERVRSRWTMGGPTMAETRDVMVETDAGSVRLRIHRPVGTAEVDAPALLYLHGGGFVFFSLETHDRLMREYAARGGFVVVGVDYPLSPEAKYPVALDRLVALLRWSAAHGRELGLDPARIAIGGDSAGANLALATCLQLRDAGDAILPRGILSNYGAFSGRCSDAAEAAYGGPGAVLTQAEMLYYFDQYLATPDQLDDPYACPLLAADFAGLPPLRLIIPELDILSEQSFSIAERFARAGGEVTATTYRGATHSFLEAMAISSIARRAIQDGAEWIRRLC